MNIASGPTGMMIPPSNRMIVYSVVAGSMSIVAVFMAGSIPGISCGIGCIIPVAFMAKRRPMLIMNVIRQNSALSFQLTAVTLQNKA
ncbi:TRAP transporter large permease subunit [Caproicibacter fermentans]|uniref:TRAP transporter large permease subunit n=1 Tax=Caproicibacter fermentans TaxID=2576756 RepID=UPI0038B2678D